MPEPMGEGTLRAEAAGRWCDKMGEYFLDFRQEEGKKIEMENADLLLASST